MIISSAPITCPFRVFDLCTHRTIYVHIPGNTLPENIGTLPIVRLYAYDSIIYIETKVK